MSDIQIASVAVLSIQPLILLSMLGLSIRFKSLLNRSDIKFLGVAKAVTLSQGCALFLPFRMSELVKILYFRSKNGSTAPCALAAVILERSMDILIFCVVVMLGTAILATAIDYGVLPYIILLIFFFLGLGAVSRYPIPKIRKLLNSWRLGEFVASSLEQLRDGLRSRRLLKPLLLSVLIWATSFATIYVFLSIGGSLKITLLGAFLVFIFTTVGNMIPGLPAGMGTYEAAAAMALTTLGFDLKEALLLAFSMHVAQMILPFLGIFIVMYLDRLDLRLILREIKIQRNIKRD